MKTNDLISTDKKAPEIDSAAFQSSLRGALLLPDLEGYNQSRTIWNAMIDKYPAMVVKCAGVSDVIAAVNFARENQLVLAIKAGGHSFAGRSTCDGGLLIDLSAMKGVRVDPVKQTARAEAGALLADLDHETQAFGLAVTAGVVSHTGIAGLTLGGGQGYLMNKFGLTIDNLLSVDMVLADGSFVKASETENKDLFWAIRGGGGNFGVVTSFEYKLHKVGPEVLAGMILYPLAQARELLQFYREYSMNTPYDMSVIAGIFTLPDGTKVFGFVVCWTGDFDEGNRQLEPLRAFRPPMADLIAPGPYVQLQKSLDAAVPHGLQRYNKMGYLPEISDELIDIVVKHTEEISPYSMVLFNVMKGAVTRVDPEETPFPYRDQQWYFDITPQWADPQEADSLIAWAKAFWAEVEPHTRGTAVNWLSPDDGLDRVKVAYGPNYSRLAKLKHRYDPDNFFHLNNNILPNANG
ncbi:FAD-binding oxidoreductase [Cyclobacterium xiamenense]|uniref:FAD-binding oxidoreductase n=1 Tax=Cyclobacterium xiamenense TaxID=1297121 RepID=UPI0012B7E422|nr:FAD-binding oxidoreductase [Cyclobacterium xiamenense]